MRWLADNADRTLLEGWLSSTDALMLASLADGTVLWANEAFQDFIGYSAYELYGRDNPNRVKWTDFSVPDASLEADVAMANASSLGDIERYDVIKYYRPRSKAPVLCKLCVQRWPRQGELEAFLVTVLPLENGAHAAMQEMMSRTDQFLQALGRLQASMDGMATSLHNSITEMRQVSDLESAASAWARIALRYPRYAAFVALALALLVIGPNAVTVIKQITELWPGQ